MFNFLQNWLKNLSLTKFLYENKDLLVRSEIYVPLVTLSLKTLASFIFFLITVVYFKYPYKFEFYVDFFVAKLFTYKLFIAALNISFACFYTVNYFFYKSFKDMAEKDRNLARLLYYSVYGFFIGLFPTLIHIYCPRFCMLAYLILFLTLPKFIFKGVNVNTTHLILNTEIIRNLLNDQDLGNREIFLSSKFMALPKRLRYLYYRIYKLSKVHQDAICLFSFLFSVFKKYDSAADLSNILNKRFTTTFIKRTVPSITKTPKLERAFQDFPPVTYEHLLATGGAFGLIRNVGQGLATGAGTAVVGVSTWLFISKKNQEQHERQLREKEEQHKSHVSELKEIVEDAKGTKKDVSGNLLSDLDYSSNGVSLPIIDEGDRIKKISLIENTDMPDRFKKFVPTGNNNVLKGPTQDQIDELFKSVKQIHNESKKGRGGADSTQIHRSVIEDEYFFVRFFKTIKSLIYNWFGF